MHIRAEAILCATLLSMFSTVGPSGVLAQTQEPLFRRILTWSEADQAAWIKAYLAAGMPTDETIGTLAVNRSSLTLPLLEKEVEDILHSKSPSKLFTVDSVDPNRIVNTAVSIITYAANEEALHQVSKLIAIDNRRFGHLVSMTLSHNLNRENPFRLAYQGFELRDPEIDKRIVEWAETLIQNKQDPVRDTYRRRWAEAMVTRYGGVPNLSQMANDPIAIRLPPTHYSALDDQMRRLVIEADKAKKMR